MFNPFISMIWQSPPKLWVFIFYPLCIVLSFSISSTASPCCYLSSCLLSSLPPPPPQATGGEVTVDQHPLSACGVLMYVWMHVQGKVLASPMCVAASVRKAKANREGKRCVACAAGTLRVRGRGRGGKVSWWARVSRVGRGVSHSTHSTAQRQRERLKLLVER